MWIYRCYSDGSQPDLWRQWYDSNPDYQGTHDAVFDILEQQDQWKDPWTKFFDKENRIIEVRLTGKVKHRILGFYSEVQRGEFVVLGTCYHKQQVYHPHDIAATVARRKREIESNPSKAVKCARPR